jgi:hypothetical protein
MGFAFLPIRKRSRHAWSEPLPVMVCQVSITETIAATRGQLARCIPLLCAFAAVIGLEYNRQLSEQTMFERKLEAGLKEIQPALGKPTHFVVKMKGMKRGGVVFRGCRDDTKLICTNSLQLQYGMAGPGVRGRTSIKACNLWQRSAGNL